MYKILYFVICCVKGKFVVWYLVIVVVMKKKFFCFCYKFNKLRCKIMIILSVKFCDENCIFLSIWFYFFSECYDVKLVMFVLCIIYLCYIIYNFCDDCGKWFYNEIVS